MSMNRRLYQWIAYGAILIGASLMSRPSSAQTYVPLDNLDELTDQDNRTRHQEAQAFLGSSGDLYKGMTLSVPDGRTILPYGLEVTFNKTTHIIFPSAIRYVDLGSSNIIAGKAQEAENVLRVKAAVKDFETETTISVICEDGSYYGFNVKYAEEPLQLNIEMQDFLAVTGSQYPTNRADIYFKELGNSAPVLVKLIMKTIWQGNRKMFRHLGCRQFGMQYSLVGLYAHNGLFYFHTSLRNRNAMSYHLDHVSFKVVDKESSKRTATQELLLQPLRVFNDRNVVKGRKELRMVYALEQFTLAEGKQLEITMREYNGGRTLTFYLENEDLIRAKNIDDLKLKF